MPKHGDMLTGRCGKGMANEGQHEGLSVKKGHWYVCVWCQSCYGVIPILEVEEGTRVEQPPQAVFQGVRCPLCGVERDYHPNAAQCVQAHARGQFR